MTPTFVEVILGELSRGNQKFTAISLPHLTSALFPDKRDQLVAQILVDHIRQYKTPPSLAEARIALGETRLNQDTFDESFALLTAVYSPLATPVNDEWLQTNFEKFTRKRRLEICLQKASDAISDDKDPVVHLEKALLAHEFKLEATSCDALSLDSGFRSIRTKPPRISLKSLVRFPSVALKELSVLIGETGAGKSAFLTHIGCDLFRQGYKVLYLTLENTDEEVLQRCMANIYDCELDKLKDLSESDFAFRLPSNWRDLRIKEFDAGSHAGHFEAYIKDQIRIHNFKPDVLIVDYVGECSPMKKQNNNSTMYEKGGDCMQELKTIAKKYDMIVWTAAQTTREGTGAEASLKNTSESMRINHIANTIVSFAPDEKDNQRLLFTTLKNRNVKRSDQSFVLIADFSKMTFHDCDDPAIDRLTSTAATKRTEFANFKKSPAKSNQPSSLQNGGHVA